MAVQSHLTRLVQFGAYCTTVEVGVVVYSMKRKMVAEPGIEPGTRGFSIRCSTN